MGEFRPVGELLETWAAKLPERRHGPDGEELPSSKLKRAVVAYQLQTRHEKEDPTAKTEREKHAAARAVVEREARSRDLNARYWEERPDALRRMGLEAQEANALAALETRPATQAARRWWGSGKLFLCLGGRPGTGKTVAASTLLELRATEHIACESLQGPQWNTALARFTKAQELARMSLYGQETQKRLDRLKLVGLLVIDDLGAESKSDPWWALFDELIDARARHEVRTCITTNLSSAELRARYGERVFRRLKDFGEFVGVGHPLNGQTEARRQA